METLLSNVFEYFDVSYNTIPKFEMLQTYHYHYDN